MYYWYDDIMQGQIADKSHGTLVLSWEFHEGDGVMVTMEFPPPTCNSMYIGLPSPNERVISSV